MFEYEIIVRPSNDRAQENGSDPLTFTAICHDEMVGIARRAQQQDRFSQDEAAQLAVGLKLFGEVVLRHRKEEEFAAMFEAMHAFMPKLKAMVRGEAAAPAETK